MPERCIGRGDNAPECTVEPRPAPSRRAVLAGGGALCLACAGRPVVAAAPSGAARDTARVGIVDGLDVALGPFDAAARSLFGRSAQIVPFRSWGALRDHATVADGSLIDGAVLPQPPGAAVDDTRRLRNGATDAALLLADATARTAARGSTLTIAIALAHPRSRAALGMALQALGFPGCLPVLLELPVDALRAQVTAGLVDGAVLLGAAARETHASAGRDGFATIRLEPALATALVPPLALVRRRPSDPGLFAPA